MFTLDARLATDAVFVSDLPLCQLRLIDDARYPWFVLVPRRAGIREIYELDAVDRAALLEESCVLAEAMMRVFAPTKLNVAALGNVVPQLHVHHIARYSGDDAWPAPVWGKHPALAYTDDARDARIAVMREALAGIVITTP
jgi:diadenosine tetraphosphate (Ap4A) HIT family hydrolase